MIKTVTKVGNSNAVIFDKTLMELARLKIGDRLNLTLHESGAIILTPMQGGISIDKSVRAACRPYAIKRRLKKA